jgi:LmbE family N-acetylglucosaminyl deacetylase
MISAVFGGVRSVLCVGAHSDDIEIGCGGAILRLLAGHQSVQVVWLVLSGGRERRLEATASAQGFLAGARNPRVNCCSFKESFFPSQWARIKERFETLRREIEPDLIFTHFRDDRHQDHRVVSDLTWNTFRDHLILEYEVPKFDGDLGQPNVFLPLEEAICRQKVESICRVFRTQCEKPWFSADTFLGLMRLRGVECASKTKYAEAFHGRKLVLDGGQLRQLRPPPSKPWK